MRNKNKKSNDPKNKTNKKHATKKRCKFIFLALERKISVRANRDELVQKGILLPDSNISTIPEPGNYQNRESFITFEHESECQQKHDTVKSLF